MSLIQIDRLTKKYGRSAALDNLTMTVEQGEVIGYLGPNGAGKTTTIRLLLGLIRPTSGTATIFGLDGQRNKVAIHRRVAYVPGEPALWPSLTGEETLALLGKIHGAIDPKYQTELIEKFQFDPKKKVRTYSKGNRQKLSLIAALMTRAELLILDEPTSGLDPLMERVFHDCIDEAKSRGQTVFLSSHILSEVEALCDRVAILRQGKLAEIGTLEQIRHLSAAKIDVTFANAAPDLSNIKGVTAFHADGHHATLQVTGSMETVIKLLAEHHAVKMLSREPSLEELFLGIYGDSKR